MSIKKYTYEELESKLIKAENELIIIKKTNEKIEQSYRLLINSIPDTSILLFDKDLRYIIVGGGEIEKSGFDKSIILGKTLHEAYPKDVVDLFEPLYKKALNGEYSAFEMNYLEFTYFQQVIPVYNEEKEIFAGTVIAQNITERKQTEKSLKLKSEEIEAQNEEYLQINEELIQSNAQLFKAKEKAEESDRLKSAFIANMSHEIRTPLNGILGFSQLLSVPELSEEKKKIYIDIIHNSGNQLMTIIDEIIDISKIEANQITLEKVPINLNNTLNELLILFKSKEIPSGLDLFFSPEENNKQIMVLTDGNRLRQILINLINNAIKFTKQGYVKFGYKIKNDFIEFFVEDTGIGLAHEMQLKVFDRFVQVETEMSKTVGGIGLGLSISKALTELFGGKIWVKSELGKGAIFYFTIPFNQVEPKINEQQLNTKEIVQNPSEFTILIAEDDNANSMYLSELLLKMNIEFIQAKNGKEAVEITKLNPHINLILMDIKMPVLNGYDATKEIKKIRPDLPIIAQTAYAQSSDKDKAIEAGCDDFISKPIMENKMKELLKKFIKKT